MCLFDSPRSPKGCRVVLHSLLHRATAGQRQRAPRYLIRRGAAWHFRVRLPKALAPSGRRQEVWRTLGADLPLARFCAAHLAARIESLWARLSVRSDDRERVIREWFERETEKAFALFAEGKFAAALAPADADGDAVRVISHRFMAEDAEQRIEQLSEDYQRGDFGHGRPGAKEIAAKLSPPLAEGDPTFTLLSQRVMGLLGEIEEARMRWAQGEVEYRPQMPRKGAPEAAGAAGTPPVADAAATPETKPDAPGRTLREAVEQWLRSYKRDNKPTTRALQGRRAEFEILLAAFGEDRSTHDVPTLEARSLVEAFQDLPAHWRKNANLGGGTIFEKAAKARELDLEPFDFKTVKAHLTRWRDLFSAEGVTPNPFAGIRVKKQRRSGPKRDGFTDDELSTIFKSALFQGSASKHRPYESGAYLTDNWQFWACLIACFSGARIGEIAQLRPSDVTNQIERGEGVWAIRITEELDEDDAPGAERRVKNEASRRDVPVHPELERIGLLRLAAEQRAAAASTLLPNCPAPVGGDAGKQLSKWMSERFLVDLGIKRKGMGFHGFRHSLTTWLRDAGVPKAARKHIAGRTRDNAGEDSDDQYGAWKQPTLRRELMKIAVPAEIRKIKPRRA